MIKPEMVPDEVWMAARLELVDGPLREDMEDRYRHALAAAINAWPGMNAKAATDHVMLLNSTPALILPLTRKQEGGDGK